ncbi:hypothetical protein ILYODFUR_021317 [Ilyodon furcidens]|uniref:Photolyase/cryptochrome alpha/beta domain-containing protein n=1 Tax=Ilyodon furcidens TaxID=33524 RepID=A0ABV0SYX0_9TELE
MRSCFNCYETRYGGGAQDVHRGIVRQRPPARTRPRQNKMASNSIHWFRKGLRLHDNPALREAVRGAGTVRCVYFLDPWFAGSSNVGVNRWSWNFDMICAPIGCKKGQ